MNEPKTIAELHLATQGYDVREPHKVPRTLSELIAALVDENVPRLAALRSKAAMLSEMLQKQVEEITVDDVHYAKPTLRPYLKSRRLAENSVQAYVSEVSCLLKHAVRLGWKADAEVPAAWRSILERCIEAKCDIVCRHVARKRRTPDVVIRALCGGCGLLYAARALTRRRPFTRRLLPAPRPLG